MTLDVVVRADGKITDRGWALNEASLEKGPRLGVLGVVLEVDGRPVSAFGCDGVLVATPTGSTAWAFSAGGPIVWPDLEAILVVPNNAHALFARPMVTSPDASIAIEIEARRPRRAGVLRRSPRDGGARRWPAGGDALRHPAEVGAPGQRAVHRPSGAQVPVAGHGVARTVVLCRDPDRVAGCHQRRDRRVRPRAHRADRGDRHRQDHGGHRPAPARRCPRRRHPGALGRRARRRRRAFHHNRTRRRRRPSGSTRSSSLRAPTATTTAASSPPGRSAGRGRRGPISAAAACPRSR